MPPAPMPHAACGTVVVVDRVVTPASAKRPAEHRNSPELASETHRFHRVGAENAWDWGARSFESCSSYHKTGPMQYYMQ